MSYEEERMNKRLAVESHTVFESVLQERDDYAARLKATDSSWSRVAAERDALAVKLERVREYLDEQRTRQSTGPFASAGIVTVCETALQIMGEEPTDDA